MLSIKFRPTKQDYYEAIRSRIKHNWLVWKNMLFLTLVSLFGASILYFSGNSDVTISAIVPLVTALIFLGVLLYQTLVIPHKAAEIIAGQKQLIAETIINLDETGLDIITSHANNHEDWDKYVSLIESKNTFLLSKAEGQTLLQLIPKRAFNSAVDLENFKSLAKAKILQETALKPARLLMLITQILILILLAVLFFLTLTGKINLAQ